MSDDDLIRDAVHELAAAAPSPKPLPMGGASSAGPYRWLAVAAAAILVIGGIVAIAWTQSDDDATPPVATTLPAPTPTPATVVTTTPQLTTPPTVTSPTSTGPVTPESTSATTSTTTTSTTTTTTSPPTPEQAQLQDYLAALAEARYNDAGPPLNEGGLEPERRADLRPLFTEFGDFDDPAARLQSWCENEAVCTQPDGAPVDIGNYWMATWSTPAGVLTSYFRSGSFEGSPSVHGLPPRRATGTVVACPTADVELVREADLDGDALPETLVTTSSGGSNHTLNVCNTGLVAAPIEFAGQSPIQGVMDPGGNGGGPAFVLLGSSGESSVCADLHSFDPNTGAFGLADWSGCWGLTGTSLGCSNIVGPTVVGVTYEFVGGTSFEDSTGIDVTLRAFDESPLDSYSLTLPDQSEEALQVVEPYCNGLSAVTEG